ncbi:MAG: ATP-binding protein [Fibrobacteria bacterium]|nr:ATP-binding protein [Fibrobacteria bacterium]
MNPFKYGQVVTKSDYCSRSALEKELGSRILSGQNTYIEGERRTGKTSLIKEMTTHLKKQLAYIDLFEVRTVDDVISRMLNGLANIHSGIVQTLLSKTAALRPALTVDPLSGMPTVTIAGGANLKPDSMNSMMDLFAGRELRNTVVVFDEFQDIRKLDNAAQILAIMRSKIQFLQTLPFVFCGSIRNDMHTIFTDHDSPFFKSALPLEVGSIERQVFSSFLIKKFHKARLKVSQATIERILDIAADNPGDTQQLCSAIVEVAEEHSQIEESSLISALQRIFATERKGYDISLNRLTAIQIKCLRTVAKAGGKNTMSKEFITLSGITHPTTIKKSLKRLEELKILFVSNGAYKFINPFFAQWLVSMNY